MPKETQFFALRAGQHDDRTVAPFRMAVSVVIASLLALLLSAAGVSAQQSVWSKHAPLPRKSEEFSFATANDRIYLFGGNPGGDHAAPPGLVQEYDPASD